VPAKKRLAVIGAGSFGRNHLRVLRQLDSVDLVAVHDLDPVRTADASQQYSCSPAASLDELAGKADAAVVATPTSTHVDVASRLMSMGIDVLVEKPIASSLDGANQLVELARSSGRILQVGHLERFNPAVAALRSIATTPLFFEIHRLSLFSPRGLDVDVVLDLMIHDIDVVLSLTRAVPGEIRAAGIHILSDKVDIANVRLAFSNGCVANLTASRVSTERVRKVRMFQPGQYISVDYSRQDIASFRVMPDRTVNYEPVEVIKGEPLKLELEAFVDCLTTRARPLVDGEDGARALAVAQGILDKIEEHRGIVEATLSK
jgi:predicted dehydrogenase